MFKIPFESNMIANVSKSDFSKTFIYTNRKKMTRLVSKTLYLSHKQVETLMPVQSKSGVIFTFIIVVDSIYFDRIWQEFQQAVENVSFIGKMKSIYDIADSLSVDVTKLSKWTLGSIKTMDKQDDELHVHSKRSIELVQSLSPSAHGCNNMENHNKLSISGLVIVPSHTATPSGSIN